MTVGPVREPHVVRSGLSGGAPLGTSGRGRLLVDHRPDGEGGYAVIESTHQIGEPRIRDHLHFRHEETFVVLEGRYEVRLGMEVVLVSQGDCVFVPRGSPHTFRSVGPGDGRLLNIISPADGVELLRDLGALAGREITEQVIAAVHSRHSAVLVDPLPGW